jgi:hypothetical protein
LLDRENRKEEALRESNRAIDLVPENDAIERPHYLTNLALVYALTGETEKAVTLVEQLLTTPAAENMGISPITLTQLRAGGGIACEAIRVSKKFSRGRSRRRFTTNKNSIYETGNIAQPNFWVGHASRRASSSDRL